MRAHPVEVGARTKRRAAGGQDDAAHDRSRAPSCRNDLSQLGDDFVVEGIAHIGAVQGDGGAVAGSTASSR
jgi:hypothetical protein